MPQLCNQQSLRLPREILLCDASPVESHNQQILFYVCYGCNGVIASLKYIGGFIKGRAESDKADAA